ncbi:mariner Mos1 transposase [Trichonephila clavipes]|nr:mariner Mos1 transposase [Trichonephila clavipes]
MAIRNNINDLHSMKTAVWAVYVHLLSSNESPQHGLCPAKHGKTPLRVKEDIEDISCELGNGGLRLHFLDETSRTVLLSELLPHGQTLNSDIYCQQLNRLKIGIEQKWPETANRRGIVFPQDNARTLTSAVTCQNLRKLGWEVLMHPPYSPDLAPIDYHLFLALQNFLSDKNFGSREYCENQLLDIFANIQDFAMRGIKPIFKMATSYTTKRCIFDQIGQLEAC